MKRYALRGFEPGGLVLEDAPTPEPGAGEIRIRIEALSLNYRDHLVCRGLYNPKLALPAVPISDGCGVVDAIGEGASESWLGRRVVGSFVSGWTDGPFRSEYLATTLGTPGPGMAAEFVVLPETAVVPAPEGWSAAEAATLPIAALTAWSSLVTEGGLPTKPTGGRRPRVLTLGTGGVSVFAIQLANALGAETWVTSGSVEKLERARALGADHVRQVSRDEDFSRWVRETTDGDGVDLVVETVGAATLERSLRAVRGGGFVALLGALEGLRAAVDTAPLVMKRIRVHGILVDSTASLRQLVEFVGERDLRPVIDARYSRDELPSALAALELGNHFGKIVVEWTAP